MAEDYTKALGQINGIEFGGNDLGGHNVMDFDEFFEFEPVAPDSMGGEVLTYLLKKKEILVAITCLEVNVTVLAAALGPFYAAGTFQLDDDYFAGFNAGASALWTKSLVITPKDLVTSGLFTLTFPYALPVGRFQNVGSGENMKVPMVFRCIRGAGLYVAKIVRTP